MRLATTGVAPAEGAALRATRFDIQMTSSEMKRGADGAVEATPTAARLEMWGGVECTINRVADRYFSQIERSGHDLRHSDLQRFANLGLRTLRVPLLWEKVAPSGLADADWRWADQRLGALRDLGITPIVGLVHHGSGPRHTHLLDERFATGLAEFAGAVAERYPWIDAWTPVNEPLTTARFAGLYGLWYPHARDDVSFVRALLNQCRGTALAMAAVRRVNPAARLVQTDDLGKTHGTEPLSEVVEFYNERRWLAWDLIAGKVDDRHVLHDYLTKNGAARSELAAFVEQPCRLDLVGVNYYVTSDRWLDHRAERYRGRPVADGELAFVDIESVRVLATSTLAIGALLHEAWQRYGTPVAITEAHIDARREDQLRWLMDIWHAAEGARRAGVDVRAVTAWSLLGSFDWNSLLCEDRGYYEAGPFDIRAPEPRPTALAALVGELARGVEPSHPVLGGEGWWRRPDRFIADPLPAPDIVTPLRGHRHRRLAESAAPLLIAGANGTLGRAFALACRQRNLPFVALGRDTLDIADEAQIERAIAGCRPWAVINAGGYVRIDEAEAHVDDCLRANVRGPSLLAEHCARRGLGLLTFSSDQVFAGVEAGARVEGSPTAPLNVYGRSKEAAERAVLARHHEALVVRTSAFFGPADPHNFLYQALAALAQGLEFVAADDVRVSPTYVPHLVDVCLDLLVDRESGIWHLANAGDLTWLQFAADGASRIGVDSSLLRGRRSGAMGLVARRPVHAALKSERAWLMPSLDAGIDAFVAARGQALRGLSRSRGARTAGA